METWVLRVKLQSRFLTVSQTRQQKHYLKLKSLGRRKTSVSPVANCVGFSIHTEERLKSAAVSFASNRNIPSYVDGFTKIGIIITVRPF